MGYYTDDPVRDAERYAEAMDRDMESLPVCSICDNTVRDGYYYNINDKVVCSDCLAHHYRVKNREMESPPVCSFCENTVDDGDYYNINDEVVCSDCVEYYYRVEVEDYIA